MRRPSARSAARLLTALSLLFLAGCVTRLPPPPVVHSGDPVVDDRAELAAALPRDRVLWEYRLAAATLRRGQDDEARARLDDALAQVGGTLATAGSAEAAKARNMFARESEKPFVGEPYERIMAGFYRGLLYWRAGEPDNARALFRSGELTDSDTVDKKYAGDWVLLDYLDGLATAKLHGDGTDALARARKNSAHPLPDYDLQANVLLFVEYGRGPQKYAGGQYGEQLRFRTAPSQAVSARLEVAGRTVALGPWDDLNYQATTRGGRVMDHILGNKAVFKQGANAAGDVALTAAAVAAENARRETSHVVTDPNGRQHVVTETKTSEGAENTALALGAFGLVAKLAGAATQPVADTRTWDNLPQYLSFAALRLTPGEYPATLTFYDTAGQLLPARTQMFTISVPAAPAALTVAAPAPRDLVVFRSEVPN